MIHLYTGDGKGKTTAAAGLAVRAAGSGMRVIFSQFMKGSETGELHVLERLPEVEILRSPKNFGFYKTLTEGEKEELTRIHDGILEKLLEAMRGHKCDMVILDEITYPVNWKLLDVSKLQELVELAGAQGVELVLTGRNPASFLVDCADYVTEMRAVRHPFEKGVTARRGIEY